MQYPDLTMIMAHMGHPWYEECVVVARKQPNVFCEVSALSYRPWQYYNILMCAQEYTFTDKVFFGTDFPSWRSWLLSADRLRRRLASEASPQTPLYKRGWLISPTPTAEKSRSTLPVWIAASASR